MMFYSKYFVVALLLILVSPASAIDQSEYDKRLIALDWQSEGTYKLKRTNASITVLPPDVLVIGDDAKEFAKLNQGHDAFKPDAILYNPYTGVYVSYQFFDEGFIELDDWDEVIDKDEILEEIKIATQEQNKIKDKSYPKLFVDKWVREPKIDKDRAAASWIFSGHDENGQKFINARVLKLGRYGFTSITWVGTFESFQESKEPIEPILTAYKFDDDSEYNDFVVDTDKVAAFGIGALTYKLLTGKKVSKAGFAAILATVAVFAKKFWFILLIPFIFVWKWILNLFKGNKNVR